MFGDTRPGSFEDGDVGAAKFPRQRASAIIATDNAGNIGDRFLLLTR